MLKSFIYLLVYLFGLGATFASSLWGGVTVILAYMLNPNKIRIDLPVERYQFYTTILFMLSVAMHPRSKLPTFKLDRLVTRSLWAYVGVVLLSSLWSVDVMWTFEEGYEFFKTIFVAWLFTKIVFDERGLRILILAFAIGAFHAAFMHTVGVDWEWVSKKWSREFGVLPETQAPVMVLALPLLLLIAMLGENRWEKLFGWIAFPIVLNSIVESYQRAYFVSILVQAVCLLVLLPKRIVLRLAPVLAIAVFLFLSVLTPESYWTWMGTIQEPTQESSANSRYTLYEASLNMFMDHPMGVGFRNYIRYSGNYIPERDGLAAHSTFCTIACETGVLGFACWLSAVIGSMLIGRKIWKSSKPQSLTSLEVYAMGLVIGILGWLAGGLFHSDHKTDPAYWFFFLLVVAYRIRFSDDSGSSLSMREQVDVAEQ